MFHTSLGKRFFINNPVFIRVNSVKNALNKNIIVTHSKIVHLDLKSSGWKYAQVNLNTIH
jgi:hypothetical protein